jgi:hypothetical protein
MLREALYEYCKFVWSQQILELVIYIYIYIYILPDLKHQLPYFLKELNLHNFILRKVYKVWKVESLQVNFTTTYVIKVIRLEVWKVNKVLGSYFIS